MAQQRVVIVGAGLAGLTAAYELKKKTTPTEIYTEIYEARDRLGGRTATHYFDKDRNIFYEEGGTEIDAHHTAMLNMAQELKVDLCKKGFGSRRFVVMHRGNALNNNEVLLPMLEALVKNLGIICDKLRQGDTFEDPLLLHNLPDLDPLTLAFLKDNYSLQVGLPFEKSPIFEALWIYDYMVYYEVLLKEQKDYAEKNKDTHNIDDHLYVFKAQKGMSDVIQKLTQAVRDTSTFHLEHTLTKITRDATGYRLFFRHEGVEKVVQADYVIMTIPFSILRHVAIDPSVGLSDFQRQAIATLPYGQHSKVGIELTGDVSLHDQLIYYLDMGENVIAWPDGQSLTVFLDTQKSLTLNDVNGPHIGERYAHKINQIFPHKTPGRMAIKNWNHDPFSQGSYSGISATADLSIFNPSAQYEDMRAYAEPVGHFIFAGEHTSMNFFGYMEGAVRSGQQAAHIVTEKHDHKKKRRKPNI